MVIGGSKKKIVTRKQKTKKELSSKVKTRVFALGGLGEVGKNTYVIEEEDEIILIDAGVKFPSSTILGIEAIIPNYEYLKKNKEKVKALFVTHGHEDHIGGIPYLLQEVNVPLIYASHLTKALIAERLKTKLKNSRILSTVSFNVFDEKNTIKTKRFTVNFFPVNHSIPDSYGIIVRTSNGIIINTGDYKFDFSNLEHRFSFKVFNK
jgi:ribonuclease J